MAEVSAPATVRQPPDAVRAYAAELVALARRLDPGTGWFAVFREHDPHGLRECLSGREMAPWDVVASLLEDLGRLHGTGTARGLEERLRPLHRAAVAAYDLHTGGEPVLRDRLAAAVRELDQAAARVRTLEPDGGSELALARDYHARVESRCVELRARLADAAGAADASRGVPHDVARTAAPGAGAGVVPETAPEAVPEAVGEAVREKAAPPKRRMRTGGSRFAGAVEEPDAPGPAPIVPPGAPSPDLAPLGDRTPGTHDGAGRSGEVAPRGARFAGAVQPAGAGTATALPAREEAAAARVAASEAAARLIALRQVGDGGTAYALLCEAAQWRPLRLAVLVDELQRRGLGSDVGILLWEAAVLPAAGFVEAACALSALGRGEESTRMLRQGVSRPPEQIAEAALALHHAGRGHEAVELLAAMLRFRAPAGAVQVARAGPAVLVGLVLEAARTLSHEQCRSVAHALRVEGLPGVPREL
ncbi:hypothetical protein HCC61_08860 [Streptomyces sp. HNM0575]|uniref:hypothetical protein n=1 Tax=Streptomyces sp. HNM0575 TaxID=2716338 RepID=UPI00145E5AC0|nr:hypothetical protein [Streptomyces sp. HNM0575]NLU72782.1 hypothetical protein [Streptomyces sp. HNM0575]